MNADQNKFISEHLNRINWIFFDLSHPGNLGASARALKVMGASNIKLINPKKTGLATDDISISRAAGAKDVLEGSVETTFEQATADSKCVIAFSARKREIQPQAIEFNNMIEEVIGLLTISLKNKVSMVFGGERSGLLNQDLIKCTHVCKFEVDPIYSSLNLSHAVQLVSHALRTQLTNQFNNLPKSKTIVGPNNNVKNKLNLNKSCITQKKIILLKQCFLEISSDIGLYEPENKKKLEEKISRILVASGLSEDDFRLLHSFFALIKKKLKNKS